jgi:hypothetical protein
MSYSHLHETLARSKRRKPNYEIYQIAAGFPAGQPATLQDSVAVVQLSGNPTLPRMRGVDPNKIFIFTIFANMNSFD